MWSQYTSSFQEKQALGSGAFSTVFEAISANDGQAYAIKKIPFRSEDKLNTLMEIEFLRTLSSDFVVTFIDSWIEENYYICSNSLNNATQNLSSGNLLYDPHKPLLLHIQMELCSTTLTDHIKELHATYQNNMTTEAYRSICKLYLQLLECVNYLHSLTPQVIHRDLKPENIMLLTEENGIKLKLTDFGLSTYHEFVTQSHTINAGTNGYRAPEVEKRAYTTKADIYSLGRIMEKMFKFNHERDDNEVVSEIQVQYKNAKQICLDCVSYIPQQRPDCKQILANKQLWCHTNKELHNYGENSNNEKINEQKLCVYIERWPELAKVNSEVLMNCNKLLIIEDIEEKAIFITKDKTIYALRTSEHIDGLIQEPYIINEFSNQEIQTIAFGKCFVLCLTKDRLVYSFGDNYSGQLGNDSFVSSNKPSCIEELKGKSIIDIKCGAFHSLALSVTGIVYSWGNGMFGQTGNSIGNSNETKPSKIAAPEDERIVSICCGFNHCLALSESGSLYSWGANDYGQLGIGNEANQSTPTLVLIPEANNMIIDKIRCGRNHSLILSKDNQVFTFGDNSYGQLGIKSDVNQNRPTKIQTQIKFIEIESNFYDNFTVGLSTDNIFFVWGECHEKVTEKVIGYNYPQPVTNYNSFHEIFIHYSHSKMLVQTRIPDASFFKQQNLLINKLNKFNAFNKFEESVISRISSISIIKLKERKALLTTNDDKVYTLRLSDSIDSFVNELVIVNEMSNKSIRSIACGFNHVIYSTENNEVYSFGDNFYGQLGIGSLKSKTTPTMIKELFNKNIIEISCGKNNCLALSESGNIFVWGDGHYGQIGNGECKLQQTFPTQIKFPFTSDKIVSIACGGYHCFALTASGELYGWGSNKYGQLAVDNVHKLRSIPVLIDTKGIKIKKVICGCSHSLILSDVGDIYSFGYNDCGQLGTGGTKHSKHITKIKSSIKFDDIYTTCFDDMSAGLSQTGDYYIWGNCGDATPTPKRCDLTSFDEIFAKFSKYRFTAKAIVIKNA